MNLVQLAVLFFFLAAYSTLAVALLARVIIASVNDFRASKPEEEPGVNRNNNAAGRAWAK